MAIYSWFSHWKWWFSIVMLVYQRVTPHFYVSAKSHLKAMKPAKVKWLSTSSRGLLPKSEVSTAAVCSAKEQHTSLNKSKFPHIDNHEMYIRHVASLYLYILHTQSCSEWHPIICMCIIYIYIFKKKQPAQIMSHWCCQFACSRLQDYRDRWVKNPKHHLVHPKSPKRQVLTMAPMRVYASAKTRCPCRSVQSNMH